jgi:predicted nuclease of predicted toxin-antitoxin system
MGQLEAFGECGAHPTTGDVLAVQSRLWNGGLLRAAGAVDTLIAAYAMKNDAAVLHYDSDFEHIASVVPGFAHRWIVPRGSV